MLKLLKIFACTCFSRGLSHARLHLLKSQHFDVATRFFFKFFSIFFFFFSYLFRPLVRNRNKKQNTWKIFIWEKDIICLLTTLFNKIFDWSKLNFIYEFRDFEIERLHSNYTCRYKYIYIGICLHVRYKVSYTYYILLFQNYLY